MKRFKFLFAALLVMSAAGLFAFRSIEKTKPSTLKDTKQTTFCFVFCLAGKTYETATVAERRTRCNWKLSDPTCGGFTNVCKVCVSSTSLYEDNTDNSCNGTCNDKSITGNTKRLIIQNDPNDNNDLFDAFASTDPPTTGTNFTIEYKD